MKSDCSVLTLAEVGLIQTGKTPPGKIENAYGIGIPFITPKDMDGRKFIRETERCLTDEGVNSIKNYVIPEYSVSVSCIGSDMGKVIMTDKPSITNQQINSLVVDSTKYSPEYIYYNLSSRRNELRKMAGGTTMPIINKTDFSKIDIQLPSLLTQKKIAHILSTLDDKIELNRKMNQTLEEMAQALFKSWFVDFDPVHANAKCNSDAELERAARELGISKEVLELFPSKFEESELGMIPEGWEASQLSSIFTERKEKVKDRVDAVVMSVVQTGEIVNPEDVFTKQVHSKDISKYKLLYPTDLGFNPSRINIGSAGFNKLGMMGAMSPVYTVMKFNNIKYFSYMELFMKKTSTKKWIEILASGSVRQSLSQKYFLSIPVVIPADNVLEAFNSVYDSFQAKVNSFKLEIDILEKTRDILLPNLLSGELDVSNIDIEVI